MAQVNVYRWDDEGAPVVSTTAPSEYLTVLKKCLVEGYGAKQPAGWNVAEEITDTPYLALSNSAAGSGGCIILSAPNDNAYTDITARSCQDFISKEQTSRVGSQIMFDGSISTGKNTKWVLFATDVAFYFFGWATRFTGNYTESYNVIGFFAGDFQSHYPNDPAKFLVLNGKLNQTSISWTDNLIYSLSSGKRTTSVCNVFGLDGLDSSKPHAMISMFGEYSSVSGNSHTDVANITMLCPMYLCAGSGDLKDSSAYNNSQIFPYNRGIIPGLFVADAAGHRNDPMPVTRNLDGVDYFLVPSTQSGTGCCWINLEEW